MSEVIFTVHGVPAPQGSKRHVGNGVMVESSKKVKPWREAVKHAALTAGAEPITGPVRVFIEFYLRRPKGHYGTGRNAALVRDSAPYFPAVKPDLDKLVRSTLDAISKDLALIDDDSRVVALEVRKVYADAHSGAYVAIKSMNHNEVPA